jgi:hypothetical protein
MAAFIVVLGGLGSGIDFLLSETQKNRIKDWLLIAWVKFDDMKLSNFSEKEATYFIDLSDRLFGGRFLSWKRLLSCCVIVAGCLSYWFQTAYSVSPSSTRDAASALFHTTSIFLQLNVPFAVVMLATSISLTRWLSLEVARHTASRRSGIWPYLVLMAVHLMLFFAWRPVIEMSRDVLILILSNVQ